jgi:hypothetical protein
MKIQNKWFDKKIKKTFKTMVEQNGEKTKSGKDPTVGTVQQEQSFLNCFDF